MWSRSASVPMADSYGQVATRCPSSTSSAYIALGASDALYSSTQSSSLQQFHTETSIRLMLVSAQLPQYMSHLWVLCFGLKPFTSCVCPCATCLLDVVHSYYSTLGQVVTLTEGSYSDFVDKCSAATFAAASLCACALITLFLLPVTMPRSCPGTCFNYLVISAIALVTLIGVLWIGQTATYHRDAADDLMHQLVS